MHQSRMVFCVSPKDAHAFDGISMRNRQGELDELCPTCCGHGQWNSEIDLASFRSKRVICDHCDSRGWIETGTDLVPVPDVVMTPGGYPQWIERMVAP
jgi:hypothetical protein